MHGDVGEFQAADGREHGGIVFAGGDVVDQERTECVMDFLDDGGPGGVNGKPEVRESCCERLQSRFQPAPFFLRADDVCAGTARAGPEVQDVRPFVQHGAGVFHQPRNVDVPVAVQVPAGGMEGITRQVEDPHDLYLAPCIHL